MAGFFQADQIDEAPSDSTSLFGINSGEAEAPILLRRGVTAGSPAQAQLAQRNGTVETRREANLGQLIPSLFTMDRESLRSYQQALYDSGWYASAYYTRKGGRTPSFGFADDDTRAAFTKAAKIAARYRTAGADVTLDEVIAAGPLGPGGGGGAGGGGGRERAPLTVQVTNPTDIHFVANKVGQSLLGRNLTDTELAGITSAFQSQESSAQRAAYNAGAGGGTSTQAPSLQSFSESQVRNANPTEAGAHDVAGTVDALMALLGVK